MGFIKAAIDSAKAGFANQWLEYMTVPEGFDVQTVNYLLKGICPDCR